MLHQARVELRSARLTRGALSQEQSATNQASSRPDVRGRFTTREREDGEQFLDDLAKLGACTEEEQPQLSPSEQCSLEPLTQWHETDRATWVALVQLVILLNPESARSFLQAQDLGMSPVRPFILTQDAADVLNWFISMIWGEGNVVIPIVNPKYSISDEYGLPTPERAYSAVQPCSQIPVLVQPIDVTTCSPWESRVLNSKSQYKRSSPEETVRIGVSLALGEVSRQPMTLPVTQQPQSVLVRTKRTRDSSTRGSPKPPSFLLRLLS